MRSAVAACARTALVAALAVTGCSRAPSAAVAAARTADRPPVAMIVLGDSLALGIGASDTSDGFAFLIYRAVARTDPGSEITNIAIGGSTAADVLRLQVPRLRARRDDLVVLCVGGNDVVRGTPPGAFGRTYRRLLAGVKRAAPHAAIVAVGVPDVSISPLFADHAAAVHRLSAQDDAAARAAATNAGVRYVDLFALTRQARRDPGFLSDDRFHPSDDGHARIAAHVLPAVRVALEQIKSVARIPIPGR